VHNCFLAVKTLREDIVTCHYLWNVFLHLSALNHEQVSKEVTCSCSVASCPLQDHTLVKVWLLLGYELVLLCINA
jgi:hypothetical protein